MDERPTEEYADIGGLDKQIQELVEAVVLPITHKVRIHSFDLRAVSLTPRAQERFEALGIKPPKGCLMYGPPGTGKTLMARACAAQTKSCFLKLAAPQLVQMFIGDGAKVRIALCTRVRITLRLDLARARCFRSREGEGSYYHIHR